jgi:hypothetical protein
MAKTADPLNINARLYKQLGKLLDDMERADRDDTMTFPQRISALIAVGRVQKIFVDLRKGDLYDGSAGSAVRKYSEAFARPHAARGGKANPRSAAVVQLDNGDDDEDGDAA